MLAALLLVQPTRAADFHHMEQLAGAAFPEGVQAIFEPEWRFSLYPVSPGTGIAHALTADNFTSVVAHVEATPAFLRVGPTFRLSPLAVCDFSLGAWGIWYFGTFSAILPIPVGDTDATRSWKQGAIADGDREGGGGIQAFADVRLKAKAGPILAIAEATFVRNDVYGYRKDLTLYWDPTDQIDAPAHGWVIRRTVYAFYDAINPATPTSRKLWFGPALNWTSNALTDDKNIRLGVLALWKPNDGPTMPTFVLGSQAWLASRFHATWPPYTFLAFRWEN